MKIYKIAFRGKGIVNGEHGGYEYVSSKREVELIIRKAKTSDYPLDDLNPESAVTILHIRNCKKSVIAALNRHGGHPDNG